MEDPSNAERRSALTLAQATAFLGLAAGDALPDADTILDDADEIVETHTRVLADVANLAAQGLQLSPIWEIRGGAVRARLAVRPPALRARALTLDAYDAMEDAWLDALVVATAVFASDVIGAAHALEDTHRVWFDAEAPTRSIDVQFRPHLRCLSMTLADLGRKRSAAFSPVDWLVSLGVPLDEIRSALGDGGEADKAILDRVRARSVAMWAEELRWKKVAFGR